ncbi:hypothetical protein ACTXOT_00790 [Psychrobacter namhaensis]
MVMRVDISTVIITTKKKSVPTTSITTAMFLRLAGMALAASTANAAPEIAINSTAGSSTTVVEQYSDGKTATITATPNGITMRDGMPYSVTQVTTVPRYIVRQSGTNNTVMTQGRTTVTSVPVSNQVNNKVTKVDVISTPINTVTQVLPVTTHVTPQPISNQINTTTSLDALQLTPTFSTPDIINAQTKVMKILKNSAGREVAVPANHIAPGDIIEYHTTYTNTTTQPVNDINAMVSLPNGIQLLSLNSPLPTLATTGGNRYQTIQQVGKTTVIQETYSSLKWNLVNLDPNATQTVVIRAKVQ